MNDKTAKTLGDLTDDIKAAAVKRDDNGKYLLDEKDRVAILAAAVLILDMQARIAFHNLTNSE
jgi:hypothetical protein|tara:strand:- start:568 stop:756 length:189 start_codon:yes stop_codon:yes gene_type:complete